MKNDILVKLESKLKSVPDSYSDFVDGGIMTAKNHEGYAEKLIEFISHNPEATSSDIIRYETEELLGIKPLI